MAHYTMPHLETVGEGKIFKLLKHFITHGTKKQHMGSSTSELEKLR